LWPWRHPIYAFINTKAVTKAIQYEIIGAVNFADSELMGEILGDETIDEDFELVNEGVVDEVTVDDGFVGAVIVNDVFVVAVIVDEDRMGVDGDSDDSDDVVGVS
jgi:hypothetical protein